MEDFLCASHCTEWNPGVLLGHPGVTTTHAMKIKPHQSTAGVLLTWDIACLLAISMSLSVSGLSC